MERPSEFNCCQPAGQLEGQLSRAELDQGQPSFFYTAWISNSIRMDLNSLPFTNQEQQVGRHQLFIDHLTPYVILMLNCFLFQLARALINRLLAAPAEAKQRGENKGGYRRLLRLFANELVSTCELCADCAELNVVYAKHGSLAYGAALCLLTYLWIDSFADAHTSPGYLVEDYFLVRGNQLLKTADTYARFVGLSMAMPLAWRLASVYWQYELIVEHKSMADVSSCQSSLSTSTLNGFAIELVCCLLCRLAELVGQRLLERQAASQRLVSALSSFFCSLLVVLALELSGGYFNPVLAGALEYGCRGASIYQHAIVFWLGPLVGHLLARLLYAKYEASLESSMGAATRGAQRAQSKPAGRKQQPEAARRQPQASEGGGQQARRLTRSGSGADSSSGGGQRRRKSDKLD